jgi:O-Antigen ligase
MTVDEGSDPSRQGRSPSGFPIEVLPGLACVGVFTAWAVAGGGFETSSWAPGALFLVALLAAVTFGARPRLSDIPIYVRVALGFLGAFVAWNFLSIAWADVQGIAWDGANRTLLYFTVFAIFAVLGWRTRSMAIVMAVYAVALAVVAVVEVQQATTADNPLLWFIGGRFAEPAGYSNGVAALFIGGLWPALYLGSRRETPWPVRGALLGVAAVLLEVALMTQSRGFVIVLPFALAIYLGAVTNRLRALLFTLLVAGAVAASAASILDVFTVVEDGGDVTSALESARGAILLTFAGLLVVGTAIAFVDRRTAVPDRVAAVSGRIAAVCIAAAALAGVIVAIGVIGNPVSWAGDRWDDFKGGYSEQGFGDTRFSGDLGSNRYDFWRVVVEDQFADSPLLGEGSDNFAETYLRDRKSAEDPLYPHSFPLRIVGGTGLVGLLLFAGFTIAMVLALLQSRTGSGSMFRRGLVGAAFGAVGYVTLHSAGDWLWSFPAVIAPAFAWLGMVSRSEPEPDRAVALRSPRAGARIVVAVAGAAIGLFAIVSLTLPWLAARDVQIASESWGADPAAAFERLDRARGLNFLSAEPDITAGAIASSMKDEGRVRSAFGLALERDPTNWYPLTMIGAVDGLRGNRTDAIAQLDRAAAANPREPLIREVRRRIRTGDPMELREINRVLLGKVCEVVGQTNDTTFCD